MNGLCKMLMFTLEHICIMVAMRITDSGVILCEITSVILNYRLFCSRIDKYNYLQNRKALTPYYYTLCDCCGCDCTTMQI